MTPATRNDRPAGKFAILAIFAAITAYLILRTWGTQPQIMADEWYYSKLSRLQDLKESMLPSYLYLWLMGKSNACGARFYDCVHVANVLFMVAGAPFVYLIARQVTGRRVALGVALAATLAPFNLYTTYFMPETAYYFGFCVLSWVALTRTGWHWVRWSLTLGVTLGLLSLVKVHALFLLPPLVLFILYARWAAGPRWLAPALGSVGLALGSAAAVKFGIGYLLAGRDGLQLLGSFYQANANSAGNRPIASLVAPALVSARGHLMVLAVLVPLPLAITLHSLLRRHARAQAGKPELLQLWALLVLGATVGVTFLFTATLYSPATPQEGLRLHMRYYSFVLPLLWLVAGAALAGQEQQERPPRPRLRWTIAAVLGLTMLYALVKLPTYAFNPVDGPDIFMFRPDAWRGRLIIGLGLITLLLWALGRRLATRLFLFVALPLNLLAGLAMSNKITLHNHDETSADRAGALVLARVPSAERRYLTVAGSDAVEILRTQFHIDDKDSQLMLVPDNEALGDERVQTARKWLLVMHKHALPPAYKPLYSSDEFSLYRLAGSERTIGSTSFSQPFGQGIVSAAEGLSKAEPFGRWSDGKQVVLHLNTALPATVRVRIKALSYADNADKPFRLSIGNSSVTFRVPNYPMEERVLTLNTDGRQRSIVIDVPHPVSPQEHDHTSDTRMLGIALGEMTVSVPEP